MCRRVSTSAIREQGTSARSLKVGVSPLGSSAVAAPSRSAVTDARGRFAFTNVSPGTYLLTGIAQNHIAGVVRATVKPLATTALDTTFVDIAMMPTGKFYGTVTLENATNHQSTVVYVDGSSYVAVTNAAGGYLIEGVPVGNWTVRGTHPGYLDRSVNGSITAAGDSIPLASFQLPLNSNIAPTASPSAPTSPVAHTLTGLSGSGSDADGTIARYEWDFTNDGTFDYTSPSTASTTHDYGTAGTYTAKLRVTDNNGAIGLAVVTVNVVDGVFVSPTGNDGNPGTYNQPVLTIRQRPHHRASSPTATTSSSPRARTRRRRRSRPAKEVRGGMTTGSTWTQTLGNYSIVNVGTSPATISGANAATLLSGVDIRASNQVTAGGTSIALHISNSTSALLLTDCKFTAGNGARRSVEVAGRQRRPRERCATASPAAFGGIPGGGNGGTGGVGGGGMGSTRVAPTWAATTAVSAALPSRARPAAPARTASTPARRLTERTARPWRTAARPSAGVWTSRGRQQRRQRRRWRGRWRRWRRWEYDDRNVLRQQRDGRERRRRWWWRRIRCGRHRWQRRRRLVRGVPLQRDCPRSPCATSRRRTAATGGNGGAGGMFGNGAGGANGVAGTGAPNSGGTGGAGATGIRGGGGGAPAAVARAASRACVANAGASGGTSLEQLVHDRPARQRRHGRYPPGDAHPGPDRPHRKRLADGNAAGELATRIVTLHIGRGSGSTAPRPNGFVGRISYDYFPRCASCANR